MDAGAFRLSPSQTGPNSEGMHYDPWLDLQQNWPSVRLLVEPMYDDLLGEVRDGGRTIAVRSGTTAAQRRCTLAHEIVHLERGLRDCGRWLDREELVVHGIATRRLIRTWELTAAIRDLGGTGDRAALAGALHVDSETAALRLSQLTSAERSAIRRTLTRVTPLWAVA